MTHPVRPAGPEDLAALPAVEAAADEVFAELGIGPLPTGAADVEELGRAACVVVAGEPVVGFARVEVADDEAHLEQLSVLPTAARRGVGGSLVEAAAEWAARRGHEWLTLCTFADVPWNAPFYARHGFEVTEELGPGLRSLRATERRVGLDELGRRVVMRRGVGSRAVLVDVAAGLVGVLGDDLLGVYAHGSLVAGDFAPARSDIDVFALVDRPPDEQMLAAVAPVLADIEGRHPAWRGRLEVETVGRPTVETFVGGDPNVGHAIMRVSPGEPLHLLPATEHRVLTWATVREKGRALVGPPAPSVLPAVSPEMERAALLRHVRDWPAWVEDMRHVGGQVYSVLSLCRAWCAVVYGEQRSKRAAADRFADTAAPADAALARWARDWWYADGSDDEPGRHDEVRDFVRRTCTSLLTAEAGRGVSPA